MQTPSLTPAQRHRVKELFDEAYEMAPALQACWLSAVCGNDEAIKAEVEKFLQAAASENSMLEHQSAAELLALPTPVAAMLGHTVGSYRLLRELGHGGMGTVYLAERADGVHRELVALKLVQSTFHREAVLRFQRERELLARLNHSNIARLLDGGNTEMGWLYLVMEYVEGQSITRYCRERNLSLTERLKLFRMVCAAVQFAHQNFIVHRDLKPDNIFVTADGTPKLLDFGIAKLLDRDSNSSAPSTLTRASHQPFTPLYASPEQIRNETITAASDVYSLGVLLYELLTGTKPYRAKTDAEILRAVCEEEPERPSTRANSEKAQAASPLPNSEFRIPSSLLRGDLDNIVLKALRKEPAQRYATVGQLSDDLERYLSGKPVTARPATLRYRAGKYVRRNKATVAAVSTLVFALLIGGLVAFWQLRASQARERVQRRQLYAADMRQAGQDWAERNLLRARELVVRHQPMNDAATAEDLRGFEWFYLWNALHPPQQTLQHRSDTNEFAITADRAHFYVSTHNGAIERWNLTTRQFESIFAQLPTRSRALALAHDARRLAAGGEQGSLAVWDIDTGRQLFKNPDDFKPRVHVVTLSDDGNLLLTGGNDGLVYAWDVNSGRLLQTLRYSEKWIQGIQFSPDGKFFAVSGTGDKTVKIWETASFRPRQPLTGSTQSFFNLTFSPDGNYLTAVNRDGQLLIWSLAEERLLQTITCDPADRVWDLAFSPDGKTLATAGGGRIIRLWDWATGRQLSSIPLEAEVSTIAFLPHSEEQILFVTAGTETKMLNFQHLKSPMLVMPSASIVSCLAVSPNGQSLAYGEASGTLWLRNLSTGQQVSFPVAPNMPIESVAFSPDSQTLALAYGFNDQQGTLELRNPNTGAVKLSPVALNHYVNHIAFAPDGKTLATANNNGSITVRKLSDLQPALTMQTEPADVHSVFYSPDGQRLISLHNGYLARGWDAHSGSQLFAFRCYTLGGYSPDGRYFVSTSDNHNIILHDGVTGQALRSLSGHSEFMASLVFTPDGKRLATAGDDLDLRLWDIETGAELLALKGHTSRVMALAFSRDGQTLYSGSKDKTLRIWRTATKAEVRARSTPGK